MKKDNKTNLVIPLEKESYVVYTRYENDGCNYNNEYQFDKKDEFLKFVDGRPATDIYGDCHICNYYEHINEAYIKGDIDVKSLYENVHSFKQEQTQTESFKLKAGDLILYRNGEIRMIRKK